MLLLRLVLWAQTAQVASCTVEYEMSQAAHQVNCPMVKGGFGFKQCRQNGCNSARQFHSATAVFMSEVASL